MGGTSTDVALCPGRVPATAESVITDLPLRLPVIDIHTVGAGGGSVAYVDAGGGLRVGPRSAGAVPGPACYGRGGQEATVTDANLVLGRLDPGGFLGGRGDVTLDVAAAERVVRDLGDRLGLSLHEAALGVVRIANATMERALRRVSVEQGHDPRRFALLPFGGAGPLHACDLADSLGIGRILIPPIPGVLSAYGMLVADIASDASQSLLMAAVDAIAAPDAVQSAYDEMRTRVTATLARDGVDEPRLGRVAGHALSRPELRTHRATHDPTYAGTPGRRGVRIPRRTRTTLRLRHARRTGGGRQPARARHPVPAHSRACRATNCRAKTPSPHGWATSRSGSRPRARCRPPAMRGSDWFPATASTVPRSSSSSIQRSSSRRTGAAASTSTPTSGWRGRRRMDPITLQLYRHRFAGAAEEMGVTLRRTAYSPNIKERRDFSCAIFDGEGRMIAQAAHIPVHLGSMPVSVLTILDRIEMGARRRRHPQRSLPRRHSPARHHPGLAGLPAADDDQPTSSSPTAPTTPMSAA